MGQSVQHSSVACQTLFCFATAIAAVTVVRILVLVLEIPNDREMTASDCRAWSTLLSCPQTTVSIKPLFHLFHLLAHAKHCKIGTTIVRRGGGGGRNNHCHSDSMVTDSRLSSLLKSHHHLMNHTPASAVLHGAPPPIFHKVSGGGLMAHSHGGCLGDVVVFIHPQCRWRGRQWCAIASR